MFRILFLALVLVVFIIRMYYGMRVRRQNPSHQELDGKAVQREGLWSVIGRTILFFVLMAVLLLYIINPVWIAAQEFPVPDFLCWVGVGICVIGIVLLAWTHETLGRQWSGQLTLQSDHQLITTGPYRFVRHPMYTSLFTFFIGITLVSTSWVLLVVVMSAILILYNRISKEEAMMQGQFGDAYKEYMKHTGRLLPKF